MSYYTGPSEQPLVPLRLRIAVQLDGSKDIELRQFISRDLRMLLAQNQKSAIAEAYNVASPSGKEVHRIDHQRHRSVSSRFPPMPSRSSPYQIEYSL